MMGHMTGSPASFVDSRDFARIARAIRFIDHHYREQPRLADIAAQANLSEFHFNRLFRRWAGLTPKQYLAFVTGDAAKNALKTQPSVLDAAYSVGLSGPGRLHDLIVTLDAMTPGELKAHGRGTVIRYGFSNTPFGRALLATTARGVSHLAFVEPGKESAAVRELQQRWPHARLNHDDPHAQTIAKRIWAQASAPSPIASRPGPPLKVNVAGTNFQLKVWQALLELGAQGSTTYGAVAEAIGTPAGARAVGHAVAANPVAWLIPCHNVLRKNGELGGYHWGQERKRAIHAWQSIAPAPNM
jgi:AraC family transcriptional regulator, regulatory protein of adaptative response / methylated-DNA-[protein]-cysteine methyltransferase